MKAVAATENGVIQVVDIPIPEYGAYECLVKITACGLCSSTDLKISQNAIADLSVRFPTTLGHEAVGVVRAVGEKVRCWKAGDRVVCPYGRCAPESGYYSNWTQMAEYGVCHDVWAMLEDGVPLPEFVAPPPDYQTKRIPDWLSDTDAVMLLTFKENCSAWKNFNLRPGMDVLVYGDGAVGLGLASLARAMGAAWVGCAGHHDERLEKIARIAGADLTVNTHTADMRAAMGQRRVDIAVDAVGSLEVVRQAAGYLKPGGRVGVYGVLKPGHTRVDLLDLPNNACLQMLNWPFYEHRTHDEVLALVEKGLLHPGDFYSHVLPMEQAALGFSLIARREAYKVIFTMPRQTP